MLLSKQLLLYVTKILGIFLVSGNNLDPLPAADITT